MALDILAVAAHPDDAELGVGAYLAREAARGRRVGIVDLTAGEAATNGTPEERAAEAAAAARILGLAYRTNLGLPDGHLTADLASIWPLVQVMRAEQPRLILAPDLQDVHPDHRAAAAIAQEACFRSGMTQAPVEGAPYRPKSLALYFVNGWRQPSIVIPVDDTWALKRRALEAHATQFSRAGRRPSSLNGDFLARIESRDRAFGVLAQCVFAEGLHLQGPVVTGSLLVD